MKFSRIYILTLIFIGFGCAKWEQNSETLLIATVVDPTTGQLNDKARVNLVEVETPSRPFTPLNKTIVEEFEVEYDEPFTYEFNAKRGDRFRYFLEYQYPNYSFGAYASSNGFYYHVQEQVEISKASSESYELSIVPLSGLKLYTENSGPNAAETDSMWLELYDGMYQRIAIHKGVGGSPYRSMDIPHGEYTLSYQVYRGGILDEAVSYPFYFEHDKDTLIEIEF